MMPDKPDHGVFCGGNRGPRGNEGAFDHDNGQLERARRLDLGGGGMAARILRKYDFDAAALEQADIVLGGERPASLYKFDIGQLAGHRRHIDQTYDVGVLRRGQKLRDSKAAYTEDDARLFAERRDGRSHVRHEGPVVARLPLPGRPLDGEQRRTGYRGCCDGVAAHLGGERVRRVDQNVDALVAQIADETFDPAEAAASHRNGLSTRRCGSPGERQCRLETPVGCEELCECARFRRAPQEKNAHGPRF